MEKDRQYRSTIKSKPFFYIETKKLAALLLQNLDDTEIKHQVFHENIFQVQSETRKKEMFSTVHKRLKALDEYLLNQIIQGQIDTSKYLVIYAIAKTDRLFYEFIVEVIGDKFTYKDPFLQPSDFNLFFETKRQQSNQVGSWGSYTFYKLQQVYIRILTEAGWIKKSQEKFEIIIPFIDPDVINHIKQTGSERFIKATIQGEAV